MLSKEDIIKLIGTPAGAESLPPDAITSVSMASALGIQASFARKKINDLCKAGKIKLAGHFCARNKKGGNRVPYYLPVKQKK